MTENVKISYNKLKLRYYNNFWTDMGGLGIKMTSQLTVMDGFLWFWLFNETRLDFMIVMF